MPPLRSLLALVPLAGLVELASHVWFSQRAPRVEDWKSVAPAVARLKRPGEPLLVAPLWAEPLARHAFGDELFPLPELARADESAFRRVLEVSALGRHSPETSPWRVVSEERQGQFTLRVLENPNPVVPLYRFVEHVSPTELEVAIVREGELTPCPYTDQARASAGGLHGHVAFPRQRFVCGGDEAAFVGVTVIDDQEYRPRRCIWAPAPAEGALRLRFSNVPLGRTLRGFAGLSYFLFRDGVGAPIRVRVRAFGREVGVHEHRDEWGWRGFSLSTAESAGTRGDVELEIEAPSSPARHLCFVAESVP